MGKEKYFSLSAIRERNRFKGSVGEWIMVGVLIGLILGAIAGYFIGHLFWEVDVFDKVNRCVNACPTIFGNIKFDCFKNCFG